MPAQAGIQLIHADLGPRFRGDERIDEAETALTDLFHERRERAPVLRSIGVVGCLPASAARACFSRVLGPGPRM